MRKNALKACSWTGDWQRHSVVRLGKKLVVLTADPVTGATKTDREHSVHINANDIAATGS